MDIIYVEGLSALDAYLEYERSVCSTHRTEDSYRRFLLATGQEALKIVGEDATGEAWMDAMDADPWKAE